MNLSDWVLPMKSLEDNTMPLSRQIHNLMYKKKTEIWDLQNRPVTPFNELKRKREELAKLEKKFIKHVAWEKANKGIE